MNGLGKAASLPLHSHTPLEWGTAVLADPIPLLIDHAFLEKKAANNALELMTRWPGDWVEGWVETMTAIARDEAAHLAQVTRLLIRRGARWSASTRIPTLTNCACWCARAAPAKCWTVCWCRR